MPRLGGRKLYHLLGSQLQKLGLKMGRDKFFAILRQENLLVKPRKRQYTHTTDSRHRFKKHKNLTEGFRPQRPEQLWVSDITYLRSDQGFLYLSLVTDAYSRKIVGYHLSKSLSTEGCLKALQMAIRGRKSRQKLIHHSDRGLQYCSNAYQAMLKKHGMTPSMTESYDPYQNALAERMNGILKGEFYLDMPFTDKRIASKALDQVVKVYNEMRPHLSLNMETPEQVHQKFFDASMTKIAC